MTEVLVRFTVNVVTTTLICLDWNSSILVATTVPATVVCTVRLHSDHPTLPGTSTNRRDM